MSKPIVAEIRRKAAKSELKALRRAGRVPAVLYGNEMEPLSIAVDEKVVREHAGKRGLITLQVDGKTRHVMIKHIQKDPLQHEKALHVDFMQVNLHEAVQTEVPLALVGEPQGVKEGGILQQPLRMVVVESLPDRIPEQIPIEVEHLQLGDVVTLSSVSLPEGVQLVTDPDTVVASVVPPAAKAEADQEAKDPEEPTEEAKAETEE